MTEDGEKQPLGQPEVESDQGFEVIDSWDDPNKPIDANTPRPAPLGPDADPTFPSLPAGATERPEMRSQPDSERPISTVPLAANVFALTSSSVRIGPQSIAPNQAVYPEDFDRPERERIRDIAAQFVLEHVRVIRHDFAIKTPHRHFAIGTIVISEDPVPTTLLRHARFQWAITDGAVAELRNVRLPVGHRKGYEPVDRVSDGEGWPGPDGGLATFLAYLFELIGISAPAPLGAVGDINFNTNAIGTVSDIDSYLAVAQSGSLGDLVLPWGNGKSSGMHNAVRYWSVRDTNEAAYSALTHLAGETVVPNLYRRALTKQAYSWLSLLLALAAVLVSGLVGALNFGGDPPVDVVRVLLIVFVVFYVGSVSCTHRYWKRDR